MFWSGIPFEHILGGHMNWEQTNHAGGKVMASG